MSFMNGCVKIRKRQLNFAFIGGLRMDLYPKDFTEQLGKEANEIKEFVECLKLKGVWNNNMKVYRDKNGNLVAE